MMEMMFAGVFMFVIAILIYSGWKAAHISS